MKTSSLLMIGFLGDERGVRIATVSVSDTVIRSWSYSSYNPPTQTIRDVTLLVWVSIIIFLSCGQTWLAQETEKATCPPVTL